MCRIEKIGKECMGVCFVSGAQEMVNNWKKFCRAREDFVHAFCAHVDATVDDNLLAVFGYLGDEV